MLTPDQHLKVQTQIVTLAHVIADLPLDEFLHAVRIAEIVGPTEAPDLWRKNGRNLLTLRNIAEAMRAVQDAARDLPPIQKNGH